MSDRIDIVGTGSCSIHTIPGPSTAHIMIPFSGRAPGVVAIVTTHLVLGAIVFPLRVWVRSSKGSWGWDDSAMVAAVVSESFAIARRVD